MVSTSQGVLTVLYDRDCGVCTATAQAVSRLDQGRRLEFVDAQVAHIDGAPPRALLLERLHAVDDRRSWSSGAGAAVEIARRVPALWIVSAVARVPGAMVAYELGYRLLAGNRHRLSAALGLRVCQLPARGNLARQSASRYRFTADRPRFLRVVAGECQRRLRAA